jgi:hypothetical protein
MSPSAIHASPVAHPSNRRALRGFAIGLTAAVVLAFLGALGTGQAPLEHRLAYWAAVILPGSLLGHGAQMLVGGWHRLAGKRWGQVAMVALLVSVPHSFLVVVASALFFQLDAITPTIMVNFWLAVLMVSLILSAINHLAAAADGKPATLEVRRAIDTSLPRAASLASLPSAAPSADLPPLPALLAEKLPARLGDAGLLAVEAQDHYLKVHTDRGSDLVLMRMVDACALLEEASGARVHRSWWVAKRAVKDRRRNGSRVELLLVGGLTVPVSRKTVPLLRGPGWHGPPRA